MKQLEDVEVQNTAIKMSLAAQLPDACVGLRWHFTGVYDRLLVHWLCENGYRYTAERLGQRDTSATFADPWSFGMAMHITAIHAPNSEWTDREINWLSKLSMLRELNVPGSNFDDDMLTKMGQRLLKNVDVSNTQVTDATLEFWKDPANRDATTALTHIVKVAEEGGGSAVPHAGYAGHLRSLTIPAHFSGDVREVARTVSVARIGITDLSLEADDHVEAFGAHGTHLKSLKLKTLGISDAAIPNVLRLTQTRHCYLGSTNVSQQGIEALLKQQWRSLRFEHQTMSESVLDTMRGQIDLDVLSILYCDGIEDSNLKQIEAFPLQSLQIQGTHFGNPVFDSIAKIKSLKRLEFSSSQYTDTVFDKVATLRNLEQLSCQAPFSTHFTTSAIAKVATCQKLKSLSMTAQVDSLNGFEKFSSLEVLGITAQKSQFGPDDIQTLSKLTNLKTLYLSHATEAQRTVLTTALPDCKVEIGKIVE